MSGATVEEASQVAEFFSGRSVFLTGITGFLGKVLLEKMLRSCPDIGTVFVIIREKRGSNCKDRLNKILNERLFEKLRADKPDAFKKIVVVPGDMVQPQMGMSNIDRERIINEVSVVIHGAASVRFDEPLKVAVRSNLLATKMLLDLCKEMKSLKVYVHVSTAYCNCNVKDVEEKVYPAPLDPAHLLDMVEWMDESLLESLTPKLLQGRPNTYTFTKAMAEVLVQEAASSFPVAIVRPSIITGAWREPVVGWVDNYNGPTGLLVALGTGLLKSVYCDLSLVTDMIPVDVVSDSVLAAAWYTGTNRPEKVRVYNVATGTDNPLSWHKFMVNVINIPFDYPSSIIVRYPSPAYTNIKMMHNLRLFAFHYLPAHALDLVLKAVGKKPCLSRLYERIKGSLDAYEYFTTQEWNFETDNVRALYSELNSTDKKTYNIDVTQIDWSTYLVSYCLGIRQFVIKEDLSTVPAGKRHVTKLYWLSKAGNAICLFGAWQLLKAINWDPVDMAMTVGGFF
ncbi:fatty acyl-CoA reductase 1-like [Ornithodoros turicata]|uniref:fatty acyl-CoA reductase 1-like n=1 Tax=Ornithodoros turicata TaxID=34597 RepID=UPI003139D46C